MREFFRSNMHCANSAARLELISEDPFGYVSFTTAG